jgi:hypothetical protein
MYSNFYFCPILMKQNFLDRVSKNTPTSNFIKIRPVKAELSHADGRTDRYDKANRRFSQYCEKA